jgi:hypothetical protein
MIFLVLEERKGQKKGVSTSNDILQFTLFTGAIQMY